MIRGAPAYAVGVCASVFALHAVAQAPASAPAPLVPAPQARPCPDGVAPGTRCLAGRDSAGAHYWLAVPPDWKGTLVVHAHGGPELGEPKPERAAADLTRWSVWTRAGYAYAGSGFHQGGVALRSAAEDVERVRQIFISAIGAPKITVLHGQSWGAGVAAKAAEMFGSGSTPAYDGLLLSSGVLGGGTPSYDFRLDLRVVYQAVCANHPRADEPAYPLWQGLPLDSKLTRAELAARIDDCTGAGKPAAERSAVQQRNLTTITGAVGIAEGSLHGHMNWATWHFQNIAFQRLAGRNAFGNDGVRYRGSADDEALNRKVARYRADPDAVATFTADAGLQGRIAVPVLTVHAIEDPVAFVELESVFRDTMARGGSAGRLVQTFTDDREHSYLSDAQYVTLMRALIDWVERGEKPTPAGIAARCKTLEPSFDPTRGCRFVGGYAPQPLSARVPTR